MLENFFKLNSNIPVEIENQDDFLELLKQNSDIKNIIYKHDELNSSKIKNCNFSNCSFSKTTIQDVTFIDCKFVDCLFIGTIIQKCEFHNCVFENVNTFKIAIEDTYVNPEIFIHAIKGVSYSNIGIHLFQQLLLNSQKQGQQKFARIAEYNFNKWRDKLIFNKYWNKKPYKISIWQFLKEFPLNVVFRWTFGYGLRFRNFILTFIVCFVSFFLINKYNWTDYSLKHKDINIEAFNPDSVTITSNLLYTIDVTTKLVDSQFQPTSNTGMFWLCIQSIVAFVLLSALITILINRFVK
jgi:hypothetical protein